MREMRTASHFAWFSKTTMSGFAVLALIALTLVLARPICDTFGGGLAALGHLAGSEQSNHDDDFETCCASIGDETPLASVSAIPFAQPAGAVLIAALPATPRFSAMRRRIALVPPDRPPRLRPYYARTARILV